MRILLVEDVADVGEAIVARLQRVGHAVDWASDGDDGAGLLATQAYDMVILDVMLPGRDGFSILKSYRAGGGKSPVLILTARSQIDDRVSALDLGADDYLVKPFDFRELEARVRALLRRNQGPATNDLACGDVVLDRSSREVRVGERAVELTRRETAVLEALMTRPGRIFPKEDLFEQVFALEADAGTNAIELYVGRLRKKLQGARVQIKTLRGLGYQILADAH
ncbi:MAG: response regulator transcription factor [Hyphomicrobiaceae bacterium]|nr:response regulator transcription factor [Hyphomicrobiaceae bacterium]